MWVFAILIAVATIYFGAHDVALAQATTPNVTPPFQGLQLQSLQRSRIA